MRGGITNNPFQIKTPEKLNPDETVNLFVDVIGDYQKIIAEGHTFVMGPRGIGKSMIFRYLQPDCQCLTQKKDISNLDFLGLYIPLRNASFTTITELRRLENNASQIINEHIMCVYFMQMIFSTLSNEELYGKNHIEWNDQARQYFRFVEAGFLSENTTVSIDELDSMCINDVFAVLAQQAEKYYRQAIDYTKRLSFTSGSTDQTNADASHLHAGLLRDLAAYYQDPPQKNIPSNNPFDTAQGLREILDEVGTDKNVIIAPMNNKISTVGAAIVALERQDIQLCYAPATYYNTVNYSTAGDKCYLFSLDDIVMAG